MSFVSLHTPKSYQSVGSNTVPPLFSARNKAKEIAISSPALTLYDYDLEPIEIPYQREATYDVVLELIQNPESKTRFLKMSVNGDVQQISPVIGTEITMMGQEYELILPEETNDNTTAPAGEQRAFLVHVDSGKTYAFKGLRQQAELTLHREGKTLVSAPPPTIYSRPPITKHTMFSPIVSRFNSMKAPSLFLNNSPVALALDANNKQHGLLAYNPITRETYSSEHLGENQYTLSIPEQPRQNDKKTTRTGGLLSRLRRRKAQQQEPKQAPDLTSDSSTSAVTKDWLVTTHPSSQQITLSSYTGDTNSLQTKTATPEQSAEATVLTPDGPLALKRGLEHKRTGIRATNTTSLASTQWLEHSDQVTLNGQNYQFLPGSDEAPPQLETSATELILTNADTFKWEGYDGKIDFNLDTGKEELHLDDPDGDESWVFEFNDHMAELDDDLTLSSNESLFFRRTLNATSGNLGVEVYSRYDFKSSNDKPFQVILDGVRYEMTSLTNYLENTATGELYPIESNVLEEEYVVINDKEYWLDTLRDFPDNTSNHREADETELRKPMSGWQLTSPSDGHRFYWINNVASKTALRTPQGDERIIIKRIAETNDVVFEEMASGNLHTGNLVSADTVHAFYQKANAHNENS